MNKKKINLIILALLSMSLHTYANNFKANGKIIWKETKNNYSQLNNYSLNELANLLSDEYINSKTKINKPIRENYYKVNLEKGEFEKTIEFEERERIEKERVVKLNSDIDKTYALKIENWNSLIENSKNVNAEKNSIYLAAFEVALGIKYGSPRINDVKYDADKEKFDIKLISTRGSLQKRLEVPVKIDKAKLFKNLILGEYYTPYVFIEIQNNSLHFNGIDVDLSADSNIRNEYKRASGFDTVFFLEKFISEYPSSQYSNIARQRVKMLKGETNIRKELMKIALNQETIEKKSGEVKKYTEREKNNKIEREQQERNFSKLGSCNIGNSIIHKEKWNTTTSSGNIIADGLFGAATKEQFVIFYEGIVEGFVGEKVKVTINDYQIKQTKGGKFLQPKTNRSYEISKHADKFIGKTQFYLKSRCTN